MKILDVVQGSASWHAMRAKYPHTASRAPVMMGVSKYQSRNELLQELSTGAVEEVDAGKQFLFDKGHAAEAAARPLVEAMIVEDLFPATATDDAGYLLASYDGLTMDAVTGYECKLWNEELAAAVRAEDLPPMYYWQLEQQALVAGLEKIIFVCSDGTPEKFVSMEYRPVAGRDQQLMAAWKQFDADLANYQHVEVLPAATAAPTMQLPALSIQVTGSIALVDNLKVFGERLESFIQGIDKAPQDDQGFADAEAAIKTLGTAETALEAAKSSALAQTASIDDMVRTVKLYADQARTTRLMLEKMVKARKETIRLEIVQGGKDALASHIAGLNKRLVKPCMPAVPADFAGAAKGKRTIASLRDAVDTELARAKIEANEIADRMQINIHLLQDHVSHSFLFNDAATICLKANDDFATLVKMRIAEHQAAETARLEAERAKIRQEEQAKAEREQAEKSRLESARLMQEGIERAAKEKAATPGVTVSAQGTPEPAAPHSSAAQPDPKAGLSPAPTPGRAASGTRPTDDEIIDAISLAFRVHESKAIEWLLDLDLNAAAERLSKEFA